MNPEPFDKMSYAIFSGLLHSTFRVQGNASVTDLELIEATAHGSSAKNFSLTFSGPLDQFLPQQTYRIEHKSLGAFDLFIVPIGKDQKSFSYQAIFNNPE